MWSLCLFGVLACLGAASVNAALLEVLLGLILFVPVFAVPIGQLVPINAALYFLVLACEIGCLGSLVGFRNPLKREVSEWIPVGILACCVSLNFSFNMRWPDFFPLGERLRDYSMLNAVSLNPIDPGEPWMEGYPLYYYRYWYRFGAMIGKVSGLPVWSVYHFLVAIPLGAFFAIAYRFLREHVKLSEFKSLLIATLTAYGSNLAGVIFWWERDKNWWGPSRVIKGAINEFPVWSFLIGDAHPHYLNLFLVPWFVLVVLALSKASFKSPLEKVVVLVGSTIGLILWLAGANPWEVPMGIWLSLLLGGVALARQGWYWRESDFKLLSPAELGFRSFRLIPILLFLGVWFGCLWWQIPVVKAGDNPIDWVVQPIVRTTITEILLHWASPLVVGGLVLVFRQERLWCSVVVALFLIGSLLFEEALPLLFLLLFLEVWWLGRQWWQDKQLLSCSLGKLTLEVWGVAGLGLLILPEVVFLNDPYGGENERMNTIFKVYTFAWLPLHLWAWGNLAQLGYTLPEAWRAFRGALKGPFEWSRLDLKILGGVRDIVMLGVTPVMLGCFVWISFGEGVRTLGIESHWDLEGLTTIEGHFPGSREAIRSLRKARRGTVLEAQGGAYNWYSHVATLAGQTSYLGWANHVGLLTREDREVGRRSEFTKQVYQEPECLRSRKLLREESVEYVVVGPLERREYGAQPQKFDCMSVLVKSGQYVIFVVG